jgi:hypothetical protein
MVPTGRQLGAFVGLLAFACLLAGCERGYSQSTPDDVIRTASLMVQRGEADKLTRLVRADDKYMRAFLNRTGIMLRSLQGLAAELQKQFPAEVAKVRKEAETSASGPAGTNLLNQLAGAGSRQGRKSPQQARAEATKNQDAMSDAVRGLFADPYGWLERNSERLGHTRVSDEMVALTWDDKPLLAPVGLVLQRFDDGKWYLVLPTSLPVVANYVPKTREEWSMWASLVKILDNTLVELREDVRARRVSNLEDVSRKAGEKAFIPAAMAFYAISKNFEAKQKAAAAGTK